MNKNEVHSIIGNNGSGKTVLMNALSNKKPKLNENVYLNEMSRYNANLNKMIIHVKQSLNMNEDLTLTEFLIESCMALGYKLEISALDQFRNYENVLLSNVPKTIKIQSIFFLISLMKPDICLFDEITNDIANGFLEIIYKYIKSLKKKGITSILVTHRADGLMKLINSYTILKHGYVENQLYDCDVSAKSSISVKGSMEVINMLEAFCVHLNLTQVKSLAKFSTNNVNYGVVLFDVVHLDKIIDILAKFVPIISKEQVNKFEIIYRKSAKASYIVNAFW